MTHSSLAQRLDALCCEALSREARAWPKPGLVSPVDSGSHTDMTYATFEASITALRGHFAALSLAGARNAELCELQHLGLRAEAAMHQATGGINTHRGAIFNLGLLVAAAMLRTTHPEWAHASCGQVVAQRWGPTILQARTRATLTPETTHGNAMYARYASGGARAEAAGGFASVYGLALPHLRTRLAQAHPLESALLETLVLLIAHVQDTNLLWRGGAEGLHFAQSSAHAFLQRGGLDQPDWKNQLQALHRQFVQRNLSPGGSADLLAATHWAWRVEGFAAAPHHPPTPSP